VPRGGRASNVSPYVLKPRLRLRATLRGQENGRRKAGICTLSVRFVQRQEKYRLVKAQGWHLYPVCTICKRAGKVQTCKAEMV